MESASKKQRVGIIPMPNTGPRLSENTANLTGKRRRLNNPSPPDSEPNQPQNGADSKPVAAYFFAAKDITFTASITTFIAKNPYYHADFCRLLSVGSPGQSTLIETTFHAAIAEEQYALALKSINLWMAKFKNSAIESKIRDRCIRYLTDQLTAKESKVGSKNLTSVALIRYMVGVLFIVHEMGIANNLIGSLCTKILYACRISEPAEATIPQTIAQLVSKVSDTEHGIKFAALSAFSAHPEFHQMIIDSGVIEKLPVWIKLIATGDDAVKSYAGNVIRVIAKRPEHRQLIMDRGGIEPIIALLTNGSDNNKKQGALIIGELGELIGAVDAVTPLMAIVGASPVDPELVSEVLIALTALSKIPAKLEKIGQTINIPRIAKCLVSENDVVVTRAIDFLLSIRETLVQIRGEINGRNVIPALVNRLHVRITTDANKELTKRLFKDYAKMVEIVAILADDPRGKDQLVDSDMIKAIEAVWINGNWESRQYAAQLVQLVSDNQKGIEAIKNSPIINLLYRSLEAPSVIEKNSVVKALSKLLAADALRPQILQMDVIPKLLNLLGNKIKSVKEASCSFLTGLGQSNEFISQFVGLDIVQMCVDGSPNSEDCLLNSHHDFFDVLINSEQYRDLIVAKIDIPKLIDILKNGSELQKESVLKIIVSLTKSIEWARQKIDFMQIIPVLVDMVGGENSQFRKVARDGLQNLSRFESYAAQITDIAVKRIPEITKSDDETTKTRIVMMLAHLVPIESIREKLDLQQMVPILQDVLQCQNIQLKHLALTLLKGVLHDEKYARLFVENGGIPTLIQIAASTDAQLRLVAVGVFENLASIESTRNGMDPGIVSLLLDIISGQTIQLQNAALQVLIKLSVYEPYANKIIEDSGIPRLVQFGRSYYWQAAEPVVWVLDNLASTKLIQENKHPEQFVSLLLELLDLERPTLKNAVLKILEKLSATKGYFAKIVDLGVAPWIQIKASEKNQRKRQLINRVLSLLSIKSIRENIDIESITHRLVSMLGKKNLELKFGALRVMEGLIVLESHAVWIANKGGASALIQIATSNDVASRLVAIRVLVTLASINPIRKTIDPAIVPLFLDILSEENNELRQAAMRGLENLAADESYVAIINKTILNRMTEIAKSDNDETKLQGVMMIANLAAIKSIREKMVPEIVSLLVAMLGDENLRIKHVVTHALGNLALVESQAKVIFDNGGIPALIQITESGSDKINLLAVRTISNLVSIKSIRESMDQERIIPVMVEHLRAGHSELKIAAMRVVGNLSFIERNLNLIFESGAISPLIKIVEYENDETKRMVFLILANLASSKLIRQKMDATDIIPRLLGALGRENTGLQNVSLVTLAKLSEVPDHATVILDLGAIPLVIPIIDSGANKEKQNAIALISNLAAVSSIREKMDPTQIVPALVGLLAKKIDDLRQIVIKTIANLSGCRRFAAEIVDANLLPVLLESVAQPTDNGDPELVRVIANLSMFDESPSKLDIKLIVPLLINQLKNEGVVKFQALRALTCLSLPASNTQSLVDANIVSILEARLPVESGGSRGQVLQVLANLAFFKYGDDKINATEIVPRLFDLLSGQDEYEKYQVMRLLVNLARSKKNSVYLIDGDRISQLISILANGGRNELGAAHVIEVLTGTQANAIKPVADKIIPVLVDILNRKDVALKCAATITLSNLSTVNPEIIAIIKTIAIPQFVEILKNGNDTEKANATKVFNELAKKVDYQKSIQDAGAIPLLIPTASKSRN